MGLLKSKKQKNPQKNYSPCKIFCVKLTIRITRNFKIAAKPFFKKYHSLPEDLLKLEKELEQTPDLESH